VVVVGEGSCVVVGFAVVVGGLFVVLGVVLSGVFADVGGLVVVGLSFVVVA
jgi:hypothetical protein